MRVGAGAHACVAADAAGLVDDHGLPPPYEGVVDEKIDQPRFVGTVVQFRPRDVAGIADLHAGGRIDPGHIVVGEKGQAMLDGRLGRQHQQAHIAEEVQRRRAVRAVTAGSESSQAEHVAAAHETDAPGLAGGLVADAAEAGDHHEHFADRLSLSHRGELRLTAAREAEVRVLHQLRERLLRQERERGSLEGIRPDQVDDVGAALGVDRPAHGLAQAYQVPHSPPVHGEQPDRGLREDRARKGRAGQRREPAYDGLVGERGRGLEAAGLAPGHDRFRIGDGLAHVGIDDDDVVLFLLLPEVPERALWLGRGQAGQVGHRHQVAGVGDDFAERSFQDEVEQAAVVALAADDLALVEADRPRVATHDLLESGRRRAIRRRLREQRRGHDRCADRLAFPARKLPEHAVPVRTR